MPRGVQFSTYTSPSNYERYKVIKTWASRGYRSVGVEDDRLETDACSESSGMDAIVHLEVLRGYFTAAVLPQLQL